MGIFIMLVWILYVFIVIVPNSWILYYCVVADKLPTSKRFWSGTIAVTFFVLLLTYLFALSQHTTTQRVDSFWFVMDAFWAKHIFLPMCIALSTVLFIKKHPFFRMVSIGASCASVMWPVFFVTGLSRAVVKVLGYSVI